MADLDPAVNRGLPFTYLAVDIDGQWNFEKEEPRSDETLQRIENEELTVFRFRTYSDEATKVSGRAGVWEKAVVTSETTVEGEEEDAEEITTYELSWEEVYR